MLKEPCWIHLWLQGGSSSSFNFSSAADSLTRYSGHGAQRSL